MPETNTPADLDTATTEHEAAAPAAAEAASAEDGKEAGRIDVEAAKYRAYFTRRAAEDDAGAPTEERYVFARWGGPVAPVVLGLDPESEERMLSGVAFAAEVAGAPVAPPDGETTPNLVMLFAESWAALKETPGLTRLVPDIERLATLLAAVGANRYRFFTFSAENGITLCVSLHVVDAAVADTAAADFALSEAAQCLLLWSDTAFSNESPLGRRRGRKPMLKRRVANLLRAAYAEDAPVYAEDPAHALALATSAEALAERRRAERADARHAPEEGAGGDAEDDPAASDPAASDPAASEDGGGPKDGDEESALAPTGSEEPSGADGDAAAQAAGAPSADTALSSDETAPDAPAPEEAAPDETAAVETPDSDAGAETPDAAKER